MCSNSMNKIILENFYKNGLEMDNEEDAKRLINLIDSTSIDDIWNIIKYSKYEMDITSKNIPQFSDQNDVDNVILIILNSGIDNFTYTKLGYYLNGKNKSVSARAKYGENHYKLTMQLGLATDDGKKNVTFLGREYIKVTSRDKRKELRNKLVLRIPIIQKLIILSESDVVNGTDVLSNYLNGTTIGRRQSSVKKLLEELCNYCDKNLIVNIKNIIWK